MIRCHNAAVYPSGNPDEAFFFRGVGDGQAGLVEELAGTFGSEAMGEGKQIRVPVLHPRELPRADVIKIDVEGAEAASSRMPTCPAPRSSCWSFSTADI